jgi:hypothetical protein
MPRSARISSTPRRLRLKSWYCLDWAYAVAYARPASADKHQEFVSREQTTLIEGGGSDAAGNPERRLIMHSISPRATGTPAEATVVAIPTRGSRRFGRQSAHPAMKAAGLSGGRWTFRSLTPGASALLLGLASCTGSPGTLALQPAFEVMTPTGIASVSIRQPPAGMTDAEFTQSVMAGMKWAAPDSVIAGRVEPPFPSQRIVWHVNLSAQRGISRLVVNVFDDANPYAYEQDTVMNDAPRAAVTSAVGSMSKRLLADVAARENMVNQLGKQTAQNEASQTASSR